MPLLGNAGRTGISPRSGAGLFLSFNRSFQMLRLCERQLLEKITRDGSAVTKASNREVLDRIYSVSAFLIISLPLRGFSLWGRIAIFFQSFPVPSRPGPSLWSFAPGLVILVFLALAYFVYRRNERSHERTLTAIAAEMGLQFQRRGVVGPQAARLPLFKFHRKAFAKNILSGILTGREVLIFDYFCPTFGQDPAPSEPIEQTVAAFRSPGTKLPLFHLEPRTPLDNVPNWVRKLLGGRYQAVTLDLNPEFSRRFLLQAKDVNAVRTLFTSEGTRFLASLPETDWFVEASGEWLMVYRGCILLEAKLELYREFGSKASAIASAIAPSNLQTDR